MKFSIGTYQQSHNLLTKKPKQKTVSWLFWGFFKLVSPFIDPLTRGKIAFDQNLRLFVPPEQLLTPYGGDVQFKYDHAVYWPALNELAARRKRELSERWERGGKRVGEYEGYLKGGDVRSLSEEEEAEGGKRGEVGEDGDKDKLKDVNGVK